jgi:hypothetical protein
LLFPTVKYEIIPIKKSQKIKEEDTKKSEQVDDTELHKISDVKIVNEQLDIDEEQKIKIIDDYYVDIQSDTTQIIEIKDNNESIIFYKEFVMANNTYTEPIVVFHAHESHIFKKINFEISLADSILNNITKTYNLNKSTKDKIKQMLDDNWTMEQIKNDETFNLSPFIIKINDNAYDVYIKNYSTETIPGLIYNTYVDNNEIKYVGNYGFLLL